jgi:tetratricopeptide (TPR) repeat protein
VREDADVSSFVGRGDALAALRAAYTAALDGSGGGAAHRAGLVLVDGEAGMGKTALLHRFAAELGASGARPAWGTCWPADQAPAYWPWTQVLGSLLDTGHAGLPAPELAMVVPPDGGPAPSPPTGGSDESVRLRLFDAVRRFLGREAARRPVVVILDDLQWADLSSVDLLRFLAGTAHPEGLLVVGAYRHDELDGAAGAAVTGLLTSAERLPLRGLSPSEVTLLVAGIAGAPAALRWADAIAERSGGHPFFARELSHALGSGGAVAGVPAAVHEVIARRFARVSTPCARMLEAAAVAGPHVQPDVLADITGHDGASIMELLREATAAGLLVGRPGTVDRPQMRFGHDLYRESIYDSLTVTQRLDLHHLVALALRRRHERGCPVFPSELARHFAAAIPLAGPDQALAWATAAARAEESRFAFAEAAGHLARARVAVAEAGIRMDDGELVDLLVTEADARRRAGDVAAAKELLDTAWARADELDSAAALGTVALGLVRLGARFAMPRTALIVVLERARIALAGTSTATEADVTAALARQLQHSVPKDRPRARPLAEKAVTVARSLGAPDTLAGCLLAHHDVLWTPGTARERIAVSREIAELAERSGDAERHGEALLLTANALLETGSPAFRVALTQYRSVTERLHQPRHEYLLRTRDAALALLEGDLDVGERLSAEAAELGTEVGDTDTGNVRMSQLLEVVRARGDTLRLCDTAREAVSWWVGVPAHAHAVAAGFLARAGDLDEARRELDVVLSLDDWRQDRSYLWPVFMGELTAAAVVLGDRTLCEQLLEDLRPVGDSCAVNGAFVCFMGANAHRLGLLCGALGRAEEARSWLYRALTIHRQLGARAWEAETCAALAALGGDETARHAARARALSDELGLAAVAGTLGPRTPAPTTGSRVALRRHGDLWQAAFGGRSSYLHDSKGVRDLAVLLARPGVDVPALELAGGAVGGTPAGAGSAEPVLDRAALLAYRHRLAELDEELSDAHRCHDTGRERCAADERVHLVTELRRATRPGGVSRNLGHTAAERARKAVSARIRDAIRHIRSIDPDLGAHFDRTVRTGNTCRYDVE